MAAATPLGYGNQYYPNNFFFNPNTSLQGTPDLSGSDWSNQILESDPNSAFMRYLTGIGVNDDGGAFDRWIQSQASKANVGYGAYTASHPDNANIVDYYNSLGNINDWTRQFQDQAPSLRGEDAASRGGGPLRWQSR